MNPDIERNETSPLVDKLSLTTVERDKSAVSTTKMSILFTALLGGFATLAIISLRRNSISNVSSVNLKEIVFGRQPIKTGCVNLYGSDWHEFPDTDAKVICESADVDQSDLDEMGFAKWDKNRGISYVETGPESTLTLYLENNYGGAFYVIEDSKSVFLNDIPLPSCGKYSKEECDWNDKTVSLKVVSGSDDAACHPIPDNTRMIKAVGRQCIKKGCAVLYGSDWHAFPETEALSICQNSQMTTSEIDDVGFAPWDPNHGITYIESGEGVSVTLFLGKDYTGDSHIVENGESSYLVDVPLQECGEYKKDQCNWNDKVMSLSVVVDSVKAPSETDPNPTVAVIKDVKDLKPSPKCALLFGSDPNFYPGTTAIMVCPGSSKAEWEFSKEFLLAQYGVDLKDYSDGISYVSTGSQVSITLYNEHNVESSNRQTVVGPGKNVPLEKVPMGSKGDPDGDKSWSNEPLSFSIKSV